MVGDERDLLLTAHTVCIHMRCWVCLTMYAWLTGWGCKEKGFAVNAGRNATLTNCREGVESDEHGWGHLTREVKKRRHGRSTVCQLVPPLGAGIALSSILARPSRPVHQGYDLPARALL